MSLGRRKAVPRIAPLAMLLAFAGCAGPAPSGPQTLARTLSAEGAAPDSLFRPRLVRPDGLLSNGLVPEQWGDTN